MRTIQQKLKKEITVVITINFIIIISQFLVSCAVKQDEKGIYDMLLSQKIETRDSLYVLFTIKEWSKNNWKTFEDYSQMYKITNDEVEYYISGVFYSPDKRKIIIWIGDKVYNAATKRIYNDANPESNRLCPSAGDTVYNMNALVGFRYDTGQIWNIYPFDNQSAVCCSRFEQGVNILGHYYFEQMKTHEMSCIGQSGESKGKQIFKAYGYNLQDLDFWGKCWLWEKDTVGSYGLYPFQEDYQYRGLCVRCATELKRPEVVYPTEILNLYRQK